MNLSPYLSPQALLARAMAADPRFESLAEVGRILGLTRERVRQLVPGDVGRGKGTGQQTAPRPCASDVRHLRELAAVGMGRSEALELMSLPLRGAAFRCVSKRGCGRGRWGKGGVRSAAFGEHGWRSWRVRLEREIGKLIATDALRRGATIHEAAEVSGLSAGSIGVWCMRGELPRSHNPRGRPPR